MLPSVEFRIVVILVMYIIVWMEELLLELGDT